MTGSELIIILSQLFGGLALFIFGMQLLTEGLRKAAGSRLRHLLGRAGTNRLTGLGMGTVGGLLAHSSATSAMLVGFVNAGLMTLAAAIPAVLGANIGTTLSMQIISLNLDQYCYFAITGGLLMTLLPGAPRVRHTGRALLGFGLLFLGMQTMSGALQPHRDLFIPWLAAIDGAHWTGMLLGVAVSTLVTGVIQSSGATIGMCYALVSAGVFTDLAQAYPIILGAHIGTCVTAMLASIGAHPEARRVALSHLLFNVFNVILGLAFAPLLLRVIPAASLNLTRAVANTHTLIISATALALLPFSGTCAKLMERLFRRSNEPPRQTTHLQADLLKTPERALCAIIRELHRTTDIAAESLKLNRQLLLNFDSKPLQAIRRQEDSIDEIKDATRDYIFRLTQRYLSRRQMILIQHLDRCISELERVQDHIEVFSAITARRNRLPSGRLDEESLECLIRLLDKASKVLERVAQSLDPEIEDFSSFALSILSAHGDYTDSSSKAKSLFARKVAEHEDTPAGALFFGEYIGCLDRIVRHAKIIALAESHPDFWIKQAKLDQESKPDSQPLPPPPADPETLLAHFHEET